MAITKNPLTIVQGAPTPISCQNNISFLSANKAKRIFSNNGGDFYRVVDGSNYHAEVLGNDKQNILVNTSSFTKEKTVAKCRLFSFSRENKVVFCTRDTKAFPTIYVNSSAIAHGYVANAAGISAGGGLYVNSPLVSGEWYYLVFTVDKETYQSTFSVYDENANLVSATAIGFDELFSAEPSTVYLGGNPDHDYMADDCDIDLSETYFEIDGDVVWGQKTQKTESLGEFGFDNIQNFKRCEYIQSTGTQYLNLGFVAKTDLRTIADIEFTQLGYQHLSSVWRSGAVLYGAYLDNSNKIAFRYNSNTRQSSRTPSVNTRYKLEAVISSNSQKLYIDNEQVLSYSDSINIDTGANLYLMCSNDSSETIPFRPAFAKWYGYEAYIDRTIVRDLIPHYHAMTGIIGMFDTVNNKFYANAGTGEFLKGADIN